MLTLQMPRFLASHAADPDWRQAAERCLAALHPIPPEATLGFLYATDHLAFELSAILAYLKDRTGLWHWVGSVGLGICASGMEYHDRPALSMMLGCFPADSFRVFGPIDDRLSDSVSQHSAWYHRHQSRFGIVHGDPRNPKLPQLIRDLAANLGDGFLVGGLTSSRTTYPKTIPHAFGERAVLKLMFAAILRASQSWLSLGINDFERHQLQTLREELEQPFQYGGI